MPRKVNQPEDYYLRHPLTVMKVLRPFKKVADWCGGKAEFHGASFDYILLSFEGQNYFAREGAVIAQSKRPDGTVAGYYMISPSVEEFEKNYRKATPDDQ